MTEPIKVETGGRVFEGRYADDGYAFMAAAEAKGWKTLASWGADGWDLGEWPYLVYARRDGEVFELASYCEGDTRVETYATKEERDAAIDEAALFTWRRDPEKHGLEKEIAAIEAGGPVPERLTGPYRSK